MIVRETKFRTELNVTARVAVRRRTVARTTVQFLTMENVGCVLQNFCCCFQGFLSLIATVRNIGTEFPQWCVKVLEVT